MLDVSPLLALLAKRNEVFHRALTLRLMLREPKQIIINSSSKPFQHCRFQLLYYRIKTYPSLPLIFAVLVSYFGILELRSNCENTLVRERLTRRPINLRGLTPFRGTRQVPRGYRMNQSSVVRRRTVRPTRRPVITNYPAPKAVIGNESRPC